MYFTGSGLPLGGTMVRALSTSPSELARAESTPSALLLTQSTMTPFSAMALLEPRRLPQPREKPCCMTMSAVAVVFGWYQSVLYEVPAIVIWVFVQVVVDDE